MYYTALMTFFSPLHGSLQTEEENFLSKCAASPLVDHGDFPTRGCYVANQPMKDPSGEMGIDPAGMPPTRLGLANDISSVRFQRNSSA